MASVNGKIKISTKLVLSTITTRLLNCKWFLFWLRMTSAIKTYEFEFWLGKWILLLQSHMVACFNRSNVLAYHLFPQRYTVNTYDDHQNFDNS